MLNLVSFENRGELERLLQIVGCSVNDRGLVEDPDAKVAHCASCESEIHVDHVGHVLPGSRYFYCDKPTCVIDYLDRFG